jgi:hypothetical protein
MKTLVLKLTFAASVACLFQLQLQAQQHGHLNAGAAGPTQGERLIWANGSDFVATSGYVKTLDYTNAGRFAGYYQGGITPTALPATAERGGPDPDASALGSYLQFRIECLEGPPGGSFGFWEAGATTPSISLAPGETSTNLWRLSESDGSPGSDPFGHIHGRRFTATKPGIYKVAFTAIDTSTNGAGGGPIHTPSEALPIWFQAGINIQSIEPDLQGAQTRIRFGAAAGFNWSVRYASDLTNTTWISTEPVAGNDTFVEITHQTPAGPKGFYQIIGMRMTP